MSLRRKLFVTFGIPALLGLVVAGVSVWATLRWQATNEQLRAHYTRSLEVQRIRAATLEAIREVPDALSDEDPDARQEFEDALEPVEEDFELWASLAETGEALLRIRDTGEGMSEEELARALEPFRQVSPAAPGASNGTGLGLPLTKALVEANRATLAIRSARGEGTVVTVTFPPTRVLSE